MRWVTELSRDASVKVHCRPMVKVGVGIVSWGLGEGDVEGWGGGMGREGA